MKPHNVLIFEERSGEYTAKLADLGHSVTFSTDDDREMMICTEPWQAPEHSYRTKHGLSYMIRMEVYTLGMVCLWLLFHERLFELGITFDQQGMGHLNALKKGHGMSEVAQNLTREAHDLSADQILGLIGFFSSCLTPNHADRGSDMDPLLQLLGGSFIAPKPSVPAAITTRKPSSEPHETFKVRSNLI